MTQFAKSRLPFPRSRNGCLKCRQRHKKCDEARPVCGFCRERNLECCWPQKDSEFLGGEVQITRQSRVFQDSVQAAGLRILPKSPLAAKARSLRCFPFYANSNDDWVSRHLLDYYVKETSNRLAGNFSASNPFVSYPLQISATANNGMLLYSLLATSASHMSYSRNDFDYYARQNYSRALALLKQSLPRWDYLSTFDKVLCLATSTSLCWFEIVDCNPSGYVYHHLQAASMILQELQSSKACDSVILGFYREQLAYLVIVAHVTPFTSKLLNRPMIPLSRLTSEPLCSLNSHTPIYGVMFGKSHFFFEMIPQIRIAVLEKASEARLLELEEKIRLWKPYMLEANNVKDDANLSLAALIYQRACLLFLFSMRNGAQAPSGSFIASIRPLIDSFIELFACLSVESPAWTTMMWPLIVVGSCITETPQQERMMWLAAQSKFNMAAVDKCLELVKAMWAAYRENPMYFGPYGLEKLLEVRGLNICMG